MLPVFRAIEDNALGGSELRGTGGPLHVSRTPDRDVLCDEVIAAGARLGMAPVADINSSDDERIGYTMATIKAGRRFSAARAFLHPVRRRSNLTVATRHTVTDLLFDGDRAVGVRARHKGSLIEYRASREVVLSAGSVQTPKLLQLSGIGPADVLRRAGVAVRLDRAGVGARMREHRCFILQFRLRDNVGYNRRLGTVTQQAASAAAYLATRRGPLAAPAYNVVGFLKTRPDLPRPDGQISMAPWSALPLEPGRPAGVERKPGMQCIGYVLRPEAEGSVGITSADPEAPLDIDANYFGHEHDRQVGVGVFRRMRELFAQQPIADRILTETLPGPDTTTNEEIVTSALEHGYCGYHAVGTCAMGPADVDVVDTQLRVRGVRNLRIVDCSVLPTMLTGNLNGPIMAIAWRAADLILGQIDPLTDAGRGHTQHASAGD